MATILLSILSFQVAGEGLQPDTISKPVSWKLIVSNAGFAPVPAFSFSRPIAIGTITLKNKFFRYEPDFSIGLNGKPWMASNWFRFTLAGRKQTKVEGGVNPSLVFTQARLDSGERAIRAMRNVTLELAATHSLASWSMRFTYMHIHAFDHGGLSGIFFDIGVAGPVLTMDQKKIIEVRPQIFYFDFEGNVDGLFASASWFVSHPKLPISIYYQNVVRILSEFPVKRFQWNTGLVYSF